MTPDTVQEQVLRLRRSVILWLGVFGAITFALALYLISASVQNDIVRSEATLDALQENLIAISSPAPEVQALTATLTKTLDLVSTLEAASPPRGVNWPAVMAVIANYNPSEITLSSLTQADNQITLNGQAIDDVVVAAYTRSLEDSQLFSNVGLQSLKLITPTARSNKDAPTRKATASLISLASGFTFAARAPRLVFTEHGQSFRLIAQPSDFLSPLSLRDETGTLLQPLGPKQVEFVLLLEVSV
jgi:Tfp pilus assembly protein PilN